MVEHEIHSEWRRDVAVDESVEKQAGANLCLRGDCHYLEHGDERSPVARKAKSTVVPVDNTKKLKPPAMDHVRPEVRLTICKARSEKKKIQVILAK
ncbi:hypothetical protein HID58_050736 [Brassica napus]|uniref:Uncharacterized protein n=1 Tax=Brassica napus TaxID=3708 RepID=A0ABQ8A7N1_BRANA|nr:hypothetical protein HID58_050736 [Brassica napus]